jgi:hypothetical protein
LYFKNLFVFWDELEDSERKPLSWRIVIDILLTFV